MFIIYVLILEKDTEEGREAETSICCSTIDASLVASRVCPDRGPNPQPWRIGTALSPTEVPGPGPQAIILKQKLTSSADCFAAFQLLAQDKMAVLT